MTFFKTRPVGSSESTCWAISTISRLSTRNMVNNAPAISKECPADLIAATTSSNWGNVRTAPGSACSGVRRKSESMRAASVPLPNPGACRSSSGRNDHPPRCAVVEIYVSEKGSPRILEVAFAAIFPESRMLKPGIFVARIASSREALPETTSWRPKEEAGSLPREKPMPPCGSESTNNTRHPLLAREKPRLKATVVLPTPPFWLETASVFICRLRSFSLIGSGCVVPENPRA